MPCEFTMTHRVEFADTDLAGIMHFSNFFRLMERTEHAFFRSLGVSIHHQFGDQTISWPRVHASCDFKAPLRFEEEVEVQLRVREKKPKSLSYDFIFRKAGGDPTAELARGSFTVVCVAMDKHAGRMKAVTIPPALADQIQVCHPDTETVS